MAPKRQESRPRRTCALELQHWRGPPGFIFGGMMCGKGLKIFLLALLLLPLAFSPTYSLTEEEAEELTQILTELGSGLEKVESGMTQASENQKALKKDLTVLGKKTKELESDLHEQKKALLKLEAQLKNLQSSYIETERKNKLLTLGIIGAGVISAGALFVSALQ